MDVQNKSDIEVPSPTELLNGFSCQPWLLEKANQLYSSTPLHCRISAVGLIGRLWNPLRHGETAWIMDQLFAKRPELETPTKRAEQWAQTLPREARQRVELAAILAQDRLQGQLEKMMTGSLPLMTFKDSIKLVAFERDELESIAWVITASGESLLKEKLMKLDGGAVRLKFEQKLEAPITSDHLKAVFWQEPEAWWGSLVHI
jgi:hypothetical protein